MPDITVDTRVRVTHTSAPAYSFTYTGTVQSTEWADGNFPWTVSRMVYYVRRDDGQPWALADTEHGDAIEPID